MDEAGKCTKCNEQTGWRKVEGSDLCKCDHYVNVNDENKCMTCDQLIKGCKRCEYADNVEHSFALKVKIGYDPILSNDQRQYVKCTECGDGMIPENDNGVGYCVDCRTKFPNCDECNEEGTSCNTCDDRSFRYQDTDGPRGIHRCMKCTMHNENCKTCAHNRCIHCNDGFFKVG